MSNDLKNNKDKHNKILYNIIVFILVILYSVIYIVVGGSAFFWVPEEDFAAVAALYMFMSVCIIIIKHLGYKKTSVTMLVFLLPEVLVFVKSFVTLLG